MGRGGRWGQHGCGRLRKAPEKGSATKRPAGRGHMSRVTWRRVCLAHLGGYVGGTWGQKGREAGAE